MTIHNNLTEWHHLDDLVSSFLAVLIHRFVRYKTVADTKFVFTQKFSKQVMPKELFKIDLQHIFLINESGK